MLSPMPMSESGILSSGVGALRIEQAELEARGVEAFGGLGHEVFGDESLVDGVGQRVEAGSPDAAGEIGARLQRHRRRMRDVGGLLVALVHVNDRAAVGDDEALESPRVAKVLLEQHLVGAGGELVDGVVGAHHRLHLALGNGGAERGQIGLFKIARAGINVEAVAQLLGSAVHGEVLAGGHGAKMIEVVALHAADKGDAQPAGEERIFAVGLLAAAPARIAEDVDVGRPEGQAIEDAVIALALRLVVLGAGFRRRSRRPCCAPWTGSHVAAMPMAWGNTVAYPARATPCRASFQVW